MVKIFVVSDTHFYHSKSITDFGRSQFSNVDEMNDYMVKQWNSVVSKDDIVIHLGDVAVGVGREYTPLKELLSKLNGRKILIKGNHDKGWVWNNYGFENVETKPIIIETNEHVIYLSHQPLSDMKIFAQLKSVGKPLVNYHGHIHMGLSEQIMRLSKSHINVNVEFSDYKPVEIKELSETLINKTFKKL